MINRFDGIYKFLSNFYQSTIVHEGITYPTVEHYYVAMKTLDVEERKRIAKVPTPESVKRYGRTEIENKGLLRPDWNDVKLSVMEWGLREKFKHAHLAKLLKDTCSEELIEGNWWGDTFWGVCKNQGQNHLGKLLMLIRNEL